MRRTCSLVALALLALVLTVPGADAAGARAHPDHARVHDRTGDAPAPADLVSGRYAISKRQAKFTAKVRDLTDTTFLAFEIWPLMDAWDRLAVFKQNGKVVGRVYFVDNSLEDSNQPVPHAVKCPGLKVSWNFRTDRVTVTWPSKCLVMSKPYSLPFVFQVFSRFGGVTNSPSDELPGRTLDF